MEHSKEYIILDFPFNLSMCICEHLYVSMCTWTKGPGSQEEIFGCLGTTATGGYELPEMVLGTTLKSFTRAVYVLNCWVISWAPGIYFWGWEILENCLKQKQVTIQSNVYLDMTFDYSQIAFVLKTDYKA